ncbi:eCIS core domain-containing protein [Tenacibaculum sp. MEBiC06402]|uniref:eCIS core domain-containing protein n=1 Tax=unclassified Tenacibaculum TaxID=2635139 RepID=UPI003B9D1E69
MFSPKTQNTKPSVATNSSENSFIQPKLNVGKPGDKYEVEADRAADQIVAGGKENKTSSFFAPSVQKKNEDEAQKQESNENEIQQKPLVDPITPGVQLKSESILQKQEEEIQQKEEEDVQTKKESTETSLGGDIIQQQAEEDIQEKEDEDIQEKEDEEVQQLQMSGGDNNSSLENNLSNSKGGGNPLPSNTQNEMESGFGADFSGVRVHNDNNAVQMNQELGSQAFTNGNDIYFNEGKYNPESDSGKHLLAHELTHTVQQGASPTNTVQKSEGETESTTLVAPTQPQDITNGLQLSDDWLNYIEQESSTRDFDVAVKIGERFTGTIKIRKLGRPAEGESQKFELASTRSNNSLDVGGMEFLNPLRNAGIFPVLVLNRFGEEQNTTGFLSVRVGEDVVPDVLGIIHKINENLEAMSFLGLSPIEVAEGLENRFESGGLNFRANNLSANIDGYIEATGSLGITDSTMTFELNSTVDVAGLASGEFNVARGADGKLSGQASIAADIANVSASLNVEYDDGAVTIQGTGRMNSDKFSGEITLLVTDAVRSTQMMHAALGVESMEQEADAPAQEQTAVPKTKNNQVLAGWGEVTASITPWLEGTAKIGIDNEGHVTIVGEIIVPDEIELMEQRGKKVDIFQVEIRAGYGIPLVGQVFLFASIGMFANAGFGPLVLKNVGFTGTYSTDPNVLQEFSITGTLGINAFAVLGLEAEAGVGVTILGHDVKAGVNVTAAAGLRAYAEATPTFEYKEEQSPEGGKVGESRLKGHFEAAAQLFLQLSGALFYELDSPWWSPAPDGREEFPLGEVQYPIGDSLGIGADVDWLVGGEEPPELTFSPVEFDPDKFTADVMADPPPRSMGDSESNPAGEWQGENAPGDQNENPEITGEGEGLPPGRREEDLQNLPDEQKYMRALDELSQMENANPKPTIGDVEAKINTVKRRYGIRRIDTRNEEAESVAIFVQHGEQDNGRHLLEIALMSEAEKQRILAESIVDLRSRERRAVNEEDKMEESSASDMLNAWKREHPVVQSVRVVDGGNTWDYFIDTGSRNQTEIGKPKFENSEEQDVSETSGNQDFDTIIGLSSPINVDGGHTLKIEGTLERVEINVYSEKQTLNALLNDKRQEIHDNPADPNHSQKTTAIENLFNEKRVLGTNIGAYKRAVDNAYNQGHGNEPIRVAYNLISTNLTNIAADLVIIGVLEHTVELPISRVSFETDSKGRAYIMRAAPLSKIPGNTRGSTPTQDPMGWTNIPVSLRRGGAWVRAHMLNHRLHGPGTRENLFPGTRDMNLRDMENQVEHFAKEAVWDENQVIFYNVDISYSNTGVYEDIPTVVVMSFGPYDVENNTPGSPTVRKTFTQAPPSTVVRITINSSNSGALNSKALDEGGTNGTGLSGFFDRLVQGRPSGGYQNIVQVRSIVSGLYKDQNAFMAAFTKFNNLVNSNILEYD